MIIVQVIGGLGNQMFQYAFYRNLKQKHSNVKLDISSFDTYKLHNGYELERVFQIKGDLASIKEINKLADQERDFLSRVKRKILGKSKRYYEQKIFYFTPEILSADNRYYVGYWQSEKFFYDSRDIIRKELTFGKPLAGKNLEIANLITNCNSVSIHVRRGDYVTDPKAAQVHGGICTLDYYAKAIRLIESKLESPQYFIFSDDIEWVKDNLPLENASYINWNKGLESYIDMQLMSLCQHNIVANSSFSWWGAYLNNHDDKIVIAPPRWFNDRSLDSRDLVPPSWTIIN